MGKRYPAVERLFGGRVPAVLNRNQSAPLKRTCGLDREITRENIAALVAAGAKRVESLAPQMEILEVAGGR